MRLPAPPEARPPARGGPLEPGGAPSPRRDAEVRLVRRSGAWPQVADAACCARVQVRMRMALDMMQPRGNMVSCLANIGRTEGVRLGLGLSLGLGLANRNPNP